MKLYKAHIQYETVILAESQGAELRDASRTIKESDDDETQVEASEIQEIQDIPVGWDGGCRPWGERDPHDRTIEQILSNSDPKP